jgi:hypothetical protein
VQARDPDVEIRALNIFLLCFDIMSVGAALFELTGLQVARHPSVPKLSYHPTTMFSSRSLPRAFRKLRLGMWCLSLIASGITAGAVPRPDIVVFLSDDHSQLDSTPYGATDVRTPNMERLARDGLLFSHAFVASPACAPSRAALLTGLMPARNGAENNHSYKRDEIASLPEALRALGYQTAAFGKVAHGPKDVSRHGFDVTDTSHSAAVVEKFLATRERRSAFLSARMSRTSLGPISPATTRRDSTCRPRRSTRQRREISAPAITPMSPKPTPNWARSAHWSGCTSIPRRRFFSTRATTVPNGRLRSGTSTTPASASRCSSPGPE